VRRRAWSRRGARFRRTCAGVARGLCLVGEGLTRAAVAASPRPTAPHDDLAVSAREGAFLGLLFFLRQPQETVGLTDSIVLHWVAFNYCLFTHSAVGGGVRVFACRPNCFVCSLFPMCANNHFRRKYCTH
jgi:hypothetical protein